MKMTPGTSGLIDADKAVPLLLSVCEQEQSDKSTVTRPFSGLAYPEEDIRSGQAETKITAA